MNWGTFRYLYVWVSQMYHDPIDPLWSKGFQGAQLINHVVEDLIVSHIDSRMAIYGCHYRHQHCVTNLERFIKHRLKTMVTIEAVQIQVGVFPEAAGSGQVG